MSSKLKALLTICVFCYINTYGQQGMYEPVSHYNSENGLPQNSLTGIRQDKNGFIWLGTNGGLARFDGRDFKVFKPAQLNAKATNRIQQIFSYNGRLMAYERGVDVFFEISDKSDLDTTSIKGLSGLWLTKNIYRTSNRGYYKGLEEFTVRLAFNSFNIAIIDTIGIEGYKIEESGRPVIYFKYPAIAQPVAISSPAALNDCFILNARFYVFENKKIIKGCERDLLFPQVKGSLPQLLQSMVANEQLFCGFRQVDSMVYFYTRSAVYLVKEKSAGVLDIELLADQAEIEGKEQFLFLPEKNMLLIGTSNSGVYIFRKKQFRSLNFKVADFAGKKAGQQENPALGIFYALQPLNDSVILTEWGGITTSGRLASVNTGSFKRYMIPRTAYGLLIGQERSGKGSEVYDAALNKIGTIPGTDTCETADIYTNDKDTLYMACTCNKVPQIRKYLVKADRSFTLLDTFLYADPKISLLTLLPMPGNILMIGSGSGLQLLDMKNRSYTRLQGLENTVVRVLYRDRSGTIWIGSYGKGWYRYRKETGLLRMPQDRLNNLVNVHAFAEDAKGYMWLSTNNGLFRFLKSDLDAAQRTDQPLFYNYFTREYGFLTNEFNGGGNPPVATMPDGRIVFPGMNGLVIFDPLSVPVERPDSFIVAEDFHLDNKAFDLAVNSSLPPGFNNFNLKISTPYFGQHYNLQVEYQLSGGSSSWTRLPDNGLINFNRLKPGNYSLTIRVLKGYGSDEYIFKVINFSVKPRWYQTNLFFFTALLLFALIVFMLARIRIRNIQRQKKNLEQVVAARTSELEKRSRELETSEETIKQNARFKSQVTSLVLHDVRSPLYYLNKITGNIYQSTEGKVPDTVREELKDLHLSVKDIAAYAQTLFAWISAQQDNFVLQPGLVNLHEMLGDICSNYRLLASQNNNTVSYTAEKSLKVKTQADLLQIVIRNMVDNAIKFTSGGEIKLLAEEKENSVFITVSDTGKGMAADRIAVLLEGDTTNITDTRSGMGYRLIKDLLKKMDGRLEIDSVPGKGSSITIVLKRFNY